MSRRLAAALTAVALLGSGCDDDDAVEEGSGDTLTGTGYEFAIADGWEDTTSSSASVDDLELDDPAVEALDVDGVVSATEAEGGFAPNLTIVTAPAAGQVDSTAFAKANLRTAERYGTLPPGAGGGAVSFEGSVVEKTELGGEPAAYYEQVADSPVGEARQRQIFAIRDDTAYALTFGGLEDGQFDEYLPAVEQMLDSWRWE